MSALREAAQQALEAMQIAAAELDSPYTSETPEERVLRAAITALRAALAQEQAEPNAEYERGFIDGMQMQTKSSVDRAVNRMAQEQAEPVQEPYCYIYEYDGVFGLHREFYPRPYNGMKPSRTVPVYITPPQRKPLTEEEILAVARDHYNPYERPEISFARAVERAHGIGEKE